jgi:putative sugar O-methyltransferase
MNNASNDQRLSNLLKAYRAAPKEYQATSYWESYEKGILATISAMDLHEMRSGRYKIFSTFGFSDTVYSWQAKSSPVTRAVLKLFTALFSNIRDIAPYKVRVSDIREVAYRHCELMSEVANARPIDSIEVSTFGNPSDLFEISGKTYSMPFLNYFLRYCFAQKIVSLAGDECIVELGPGSGYQVEVLKKLYPDTTILCFDLPAQIYLCETYLSEALGNQQIVSTEETVNWQDLSTLRKGHVHFFGNWQFPLLQDLSIDLFWNAASFGEMEPDIVENYLRHIKANTKWVYLLQARHGKETSGKTHVHTATKLEDYNRFLSGYTLCDEHDAWHAHKKLTASGGYFEGVWSNAELLD